MNTLDVLKSRGVAYLVIFFVLFDVLMFFVMKGFGSFVGLLIGELGLLLYYVIARSIVDVDKPFFIFKRKEE